MTEYKQFKNGDRVIYIDNLSPYNNRDGTIKNIDLSEYTDIFVYIVELEKQNGESFQPTVVCQDFQLKLVDDNKRRESVKKKQLVKVVPDVEPEEYPIHNGGWSHVLIDKSLGVAITMFTCEEDAEWYRKNYYDNEDDIIIREYKSTEE